MRVLIISAVFAFAAAAPSANLLLVHSVGVPSAIPTISPGDIQAAAIDAQVQVQDIARAAADKARELSELAALNNNDKVVTDTNIAQEKGEEAFWSVEDKKWQAVDALKTAEAQIDGVVANNADALAKSALGAAYIVGTPAIAPIAGAPLVYTPYFAGVPGISAVSHQKTEVRTEIKEEEKVAAVKTAETENAAPAQPAEQEKAAEETPATQTPAVKALENLEAKPAVALAQPGIPPVGLANVGLANVGFTSLGLTNVAPVASVYRYNVGVPAFGQVLAQPIANYATSVQQLHGVAPTLIKTVW